jgi:hypothetical protein
MVALKHLCKVLMTLGNTNILLDEKCQNLKLYLQYESNYFLSAQKGADGGHLSAVQQRVNFAAALDISGPACSHRDTPPQSAQTGACFVFALIICYESNHPYMYWVFSPWLIIVLDILHAVSNLILTVIL